jgi:gamma-glutamylcyclotransferase (GGCT)/AIG2-like uncharacterized protein YtfP
MEAVKLFVYGTLMRGEYNHSFLNNSRFLYEARTSPHYTLYSLGSYPALVRIGHSSICGEVYSVPVCDIPAIDELEEHPEFYRRKVIELENGEEVQTYLLPFWEVQSMHGVAMDGNWKSRKGS